MVENTDDSGEVPVSGAVGIDLGTTYSVVAHLDADGNPEVIRAVPREHTDGH